MSRRRAPVVVALVVLLTVAGCGSQPAPKAVSPSRNSEQVNGTSPSPSTRTPTPSSPTSTTSLAPASTPQTDTPRADTRSFSIIDQSTGDFVAGLANGGVVFGGIGIHGVGAAWGTRRVQVSRTAQGVVAHYDGPGRIHRGAPLDLGVATLTTMVGSDLGDPEPVPLRFDVRLDPDGVGEADVWIDQHHYHLAVADPPHTAGPVVTAVVAAFRAEDWSALYDLTIHFPGQSRADFARTFGSDGHITTLEITGVTAYGVADGVGYAATPAHVVATIGSQALDRDVAVKLVYSRGEWRFTTMAGPLPESSG